MLDRTTSVQAAWEDTARSTLGAATSKGPAVRESLAALARRLHAAWDTLGDATWVSKARRMSGSRGRKRT
jgi:hypothetical protein